MRPVMKTVRYWLPLVLGFACLIVSTSVSAVASWLLIVAGLALVLDGCTAMWARAGGTGNLTTHRQ